MTLLKTTRPKRWTRLPYKPSFFGHDFQLLHLSPDQRYVRRCVRRKTALASIYSNGQDRWSNRERHPNMVIGVQESWWLEITRFNTVVIGDSHALERLAQAPAERCGPFLQRRLLDLTVFFLHTSGGWHSAKTLDVLTQQSLSFFGPELGFVHGAILIKKTTGVAQYGKWGKITLLYKKLCMLFFIFFSVC